MIHSSGDDHQQSVGHRRRRHADLKDQETNIVRGATIADKRTWWTFPNLSEWRCYLPLRKKIKEKTKTVFGTVGVIIFWTVVVVIVVGIIVNDISKSGCPVNNAEACAEHYDQ